MLNAHFFARVMVLMVVGIPATWGENFPTKPIRFVTGSVGSSSDFAARVLGQGLGELLGQQVVVDNRASGIIPGQIVSRASPDGYTLLIIGNTFWTGSLVQKVPYDPVRDFSPITLIARQPNVLVVHRSFPVGSVKELIALAKAKPGVLNYAATSHGGSAHLSGELFKSMAGVDIVHVAYKSGSTQMADLIGGQVQMAIAPAASVMPHVKSGKLLALGVTSLEPSPLFPELPTVASSLPGYEAVTFHTAFAPTRTPAAIIQALNREMLRFLHTPQARAKYAGGGAEAMGSSPQELATTMKSELARIAKLVKDAGIRVP